MVSIATAIVLSALALLAFTVFQIFFNKSDLDSIPAAHFSAPFSKLWILWVRWQDREGLTRLELHRRLGPVVRIGPRELSVDGVEEGMQMIYGSKFSKDEWYHTAFMGEDQVFMAIMKGNEEHKHRKKMLSRVYSKSYLLNSDLLQNSCAKVMKHVKEDVDTWSDSDKSVETMSWARAIMTDIITSWCYGEEHATDFLRNHHARKELFDEIEKSWAGLFWRCELPGLAPILGALGINVVPQSSFVARRKTRRWRDAMTAQVSRKSDTKGGAVLGSEKDPATSSLYDHLYGKLVSHDANLSREKADRIISAELWDHVLATYEPCGIALIYILYELSRSPDRQRSLRQELRTLATPSSNDHSRAQLIDELPFLDAVVTESLRVRPPGPGPWPRIVPKTGVRLAGRFDVPGGTRVSSTAWTLHGNSDVFPQPWEWRPERWTEASPAKKTEMRKSFWTFGSGTRMCIGNHFCYCILKEILVAIYADHETLVDEQLTGSMQQFDAMNAPPIGSSLALKFNRSKPI